MTLNFERTRDLLYDFRFQDVFIEELGWFQPSSTRRESLEIKGKTYSYLRIAEAAKVAVFEVKAEEGEIPPGEIRREIHKEIEGRVAENLLIFVDEDRTRSLWYWVKREETKRYVRDHLYMQGQPGDLFLSKLGSLVIDITELEVDEEPSVVEIAQKLKSGFDIERVTKKFYQEYQEQHLHFLAFVQGIDNEIDRRWYTSVLLNRLMFVYFLQRKRKGFIDNGNQRYLQKKLAESQQRGEDRYYAEFLQALFFEGFAKPEHERDAATQALLGKVTYLNGGLFLKHRIEQEYSDIFIADEAFEQVLKLFERFSWNLDDTPGGKDDEINPDVLGYIFEKYINQKEFGAYYTRPEITEYLCDRTINKLIVERVNSQAHTQFTEIKELLIQLDARLCHYLVEGILPNLTLLDPACGSGAFLVAAMKTLISVYTAVIGTIKLKGDRRLKQWLKGIESSHPSLSYFVKKRIITDNLYGVDIMEEATEIAKLRLFLALVSSAQDESELEPLPNIDFNIMVGNSLIGLMRVDAERFDTVGGGKQGNLLQPLAASNYQQLLTEKNESVQKYKEHAFKYGEVEGTNQDNRLQMLRDNIRQVNQEATAKLNQLLLAEFSEKLGIKYEQAQLKGKAKKRLLTIEDIERLKPFHWGYHFDKVIEEKGGFDAIITNPPWEVFKPQAKEFFAQYSKLVTKNKMDIKTFEKQQKKMLQNSEVAKGWLDYKSQYPYVSSYYRTAEQYENQISVVNGRKQGTDINLYKLFTEQCFNLLRPQGECGIVIPSGIYTDLGTKQLREMLFTQTEVTGLFCFENRKTIFEGVHRSFKFVILTFEKEGKTAQFPAKFMRHNVQELQHFPDDETLEIPVSLIRELSPDSVSVMEFKSNLELNIAKKVAKYAPLHNENSGFNHIKFTRELAPNSKSGCYKTSDTNRNLLSLLEGKNINQFTHLFSTEYRYWVKEKDARKLILGKTSDTGQRLDYQMYRLAFRKIASSTNERTMIATVIPPSLCVENLQTLKVVDDAGNQVTSYLEALYLCSIFNSFTYDYLLRLKVSANINFFFVYGTQVPHLTQGDKYFNEIVERAAQLICTTPEFDELAQEVGLIPPNPPSEGGNRDRSSYGVTDETERAKLRAELDGMIAHVYGLTEAEFSHILSTFPIVPEETKQAALEAYHSFTPLSGDSEIVSLITQGESATVEFKSTARWDLKENKKSKVIEAVIVKTIAAFLNAEAGGTLLIGVEDNGNVIGLELDYQTLSKANKRDAYELFLTDLLLDKNLGKDLALYLNIRIGEVEQKDVCQVTIKPSPRPVYVEMKNKQGQTEECFFIRANNSVRKLDKPSEIRNYCQDRFGRN